MKVYMGLDGSSSGSDTTGYSQNRNYEFLKHKPSINGKTLIGNINLTDLGFQTTFYQTAEYWDSHDEISQDGALYVYKNFTEVEDFNGNTIPIAAFKIGNGVTALSALPFATDVKGSGSSGLPQEGAYGDFLMKTGDAPNDVAWVAPANSVEEDNTRPITAAAVYTEIGNINVLLNTI